MRLPRHDVPALVERVGDGAGVAGEAGADDAAGRVGGVGRGGRGARRASGLGCRRGSRREAVAGRWGRAGVRVEGGEYLGCGGRPAGVGTGVATGVGLTSATAGVLPPKPRRMRKPAPTRMTTTATRPTMAAMPLPCSLGRSARRVVVPRTGSRGAPSGSPQLRQKRVTASLRSPHTGQMTWVGGCAVRWSRSLRPSPGILIAGMLPQKRPAAPRTRHRPAPVRSRWPPAGQG